MTLVRISDDALALACGADAVAEAFAGAGCTIEREVVASILSDLGIEIIEKGNDGLTLAIPGYKADVTREADVANDLLCLDLVQVVIAAQ